MTRSIFLHKVDKISSPCCAVVHDLRCRLLTLRFEWATRDRDMQGESEHAASRGKELEDCQEYCYVDILKYETPWRIRGKVAGLQQAGSQSVTWILLCEALDNMLLYDEDQKREKEPQVFERFKTAVV